MRRFLNEMELSCLREFYVFWDRMLHCEATVRELPIDDVSAMALKEYAMDMTGEQLIPARREVVWAGLNDVRILKAAIPGCQSLDATSATEFRAIAAVKLGPIATKFTGQVTISDIDPPNGYTLSGEGQGGIAGFANGRAKVALEERAEGTLLRYTVRAAVGGRMAQLGARLVDSTAKAMADQFFTNFASELLAVETMCGVSAGSGGVVTGETLALPLHRSRGVRFWAACGAVLILVGVLLWILLSQG